MVSVLHCTSQKVGSHVVHTYKDSMLAVDGMVVSWNHKVSFHYLLETNSGKYSSRCLRNYRGALVFLSNQGYVELKNTWNECGTIIEKMLCSTVLDLLGCCELKQDNGTLNPSSHVPGTVSGTGTFPERGTTLMKDFYTKLFPERSRSRSGTRNMERGTWPRSTFPASMPSTPLCLNFLKENKVHFGVFQIYSLKL